MESGSESAPPPKHKVCSLIPSSCFFFKKLEFRHDIAKKVQNLKSELDEILNEKGVDNFVTSQPGSDYSHASWRVQTTSLIDSTEVKGRQDDKEILVNKLIAHERLDYQILSIVGVGGLGKTTLAQLVYNDSRVKRCFDFRIWICASDPFDIGVIAKGIIEAINKKSPLDTTQLDDLLQDLIRCISRKKILLVLDDIWNEECDKWEPLKTALKCSAAGSQILATTRKEQVARIMGSVDKDIYRPELLTNEDCLLLLMRVSGRGEDKIEKFLEIGKEIAKKCNGLPLAAKTLGSILIFKRTIQEWEKVLKSDIWEFKKVEVGLFPHLLLSYHELSPMLKRCFSFCAFFPKDKKLKVDKLIRIWMALGYLGSTTGRTVGEDMELRGQEVFEDLAMRSLFQDFEKDFFTEQIISCKMHDIVHDFALFLRKNGRVEVPGMTKGTCEVCGPSLLSTVQEYHSLGWERKSPLYFCDCLVSVRVLKCRGELCPRNMEKLIHLKWLGISGTTLSKEELETICKLYFLQTLSSKRCSLKEIPREIENLVHLRYINLSENEELAELPENICSLVELQNLLLAKCSLKEIPMENGNLTHLRHLDLSGNSELKKLPLNMCSLIKLQTLLLSKCSLEEIPAEIGNLANLRHLDLNWNSELKELPQSICRLFKLQILLLSSCSLEEIPTEIGNLVNLRVLDLSWNSDLKGLPESLCSMVELQFLNMHGFNHRRLLEGFCQLSGLVVLNWFIGGSGCSKFGLLKKLNSLSELSIVISSSSSTSSSDIEELVKDAREAKLMNKKQLQKLEFFCMDESNEDERLSSSSLWVDVMEALEPNYNFQDLQIWRLKGSRLPHWISSPLNLVKEIDLFFCDELVLLPPLGKLPFLVSLNMMGMKKLKVLGVEWLRIRERERDGSSSSSSSSSLVAFPSLKELTFHDWPEWLEWKDITAEHEESTVMPCLLQLRIEACDGLKMLPHRLLRKASSLQKLDIGQSSKLVQCYKDENGSPRRSISLNNPKLCSQIAVVVPK